MRIALWYNLGSGGAKRALYDQVKGLKQRGHTIEAWCPSSTDRGYLPLSDLIPEHVVPFEWQDAPSSGRLANVTYPYRSVRSRLAAMERACAICAGEIAAREFDLLFSNSCMYLRVPSIGRMLGKLPKVLYLQEPSRWLYEALPSLAWVAGGPELTRKPPSLRAVTGTLRDWIRIQSLRLQAVEERRNAAGFDRILVNSLFSRESVLRAYGLDADVCHLGINAEAFRPTGEPREFFVVSVGAEIFEKGVDTAIRAIASIPEARRPRLVWIANIANAAYHEEMQSLARVLKVQFDVRSRCADTELVSLLSRAAVMIYAPRLEPFGLAPLEANACETPVVAVSEGGVRETVRHLETGLLVPSRDPLALGHAVQALLENAELARRLGKRGREEVQKAWTWEAAIDRLEASLLSAKNHAPRHDSPAASLFHA